MGSILRRHIFKEVAVPFGLALLVLITLLLLQKIIQITDWVVNRGVGLAYMFSLVILLLPFFLVLVIPMALLLATLLAVNRMSSDCEITAMKASGVGVWSLFPPVVLLGFFCSILSGFMSLYVVPLSTVWSERLMFDIAKKSAKAAVRVKSFHGLAPGTTIYVDAVRDDSLEGVFIAQAASGRKDDFAATDNFYIFAQKGQLVSDPEALANYISLYNGAIHSTDRDGKGYRKIDFGRFDFKIVMDAQKEKGIERGTQFEVMSLSALHQKKIEYERKYNESRGGTDPASLSKRATYKKALAQIGISYHQKFSLPFACLILMLWGIPLGLQPPRATRYQGIVTSISLSLIYYLLVSGGKILATRFILPPYVAVWLPNAVVLASGLWFIRRAAFDKPPPLSGAMATLGEIMSARVRRISGRAAK